MDITALTTEQLRRLAASLDHSIHVTECYGVKDLLDLIAIENEIQRREDFEERLAFSFKDGTLHLTKN
jgi:hypothetical protein